MTTWDFFRASIVNNLEVLCSDLKDSFFFFANVYIFFVWRWIFIYLKIYIFLLKFFFVNINNVNINGAAAHIGPPFSKFILSTFVLYTKVLNFIHVSYWEIALVSVFDDILFFKLMKNIVILLDLNVETFTVLIPVTKCLSLSLSLPLSLSTLILVYL